MGILPVFITILFGLLAYNNIQKISYRTVPLVRRELDKQLTIMVLLQVVYNFFALTPTIIINMIVLTYTITDPNINALIQFVSNLTNILYYSNFAVDKKRFDLKLISYEILFYF